MHLLVMPTRPTTLVAGALPYCCSAAAAAHGLLLMNIGRDLRMSVAPIQ
jgi:hypothetical protein